MSNFKIKGKFCLQRWFSTSFAWFELVLEKLCFFLELRVYMVNAGLLHRESFFLSALLWLQRKKKLWHYTPRKWICWSVRYASSWCPSLWPCRADTRSAGGVSGALSHPGVHHAKRGSNRERWKTSGTTSCSSVSLKSAAPRRQRWTATFRRSSKPTNSRTLYASPPRVWTQVRVLGNISGAGAHVVTKCNSHFSAAGSQSSSSGC